LKEWGFGTIFPKLGGSTKNTVYSIMQLVILVQQQMDAMAAAWCIQHPIYRKTRSSKQCVWSGEIGLKKWLSARSGMVPADRPYI